MQLKLVITLVFSALLMFALDAEAKKKKGSDVCNHNRLGLKNTNGKQLVKGSCSNTIQGEIPAKNHMPSTVIISPENGSTIPAKKTFDIKVIVDNVVTGKFSDPETEYYTLPQCLSDDGIIIGHLHVVVQEIQNPKAPLDASTFQFFEGLNNAGANIGHGDFSLNATVDGGLSPGKYRLCTLGGTETHQPWIMPVAKRGAQDDCIRFSVK